MESYAQLFSLAELSQAGKIIQKKNPETHFMYVAMAIFFCIKKSMALQVVSIPLFSVLPPPSLEMQPGQPAPTFQAQTLLWYA